MGWLIAALGTGLAIAGTAAIYFGAPYMQVEWGYSEVIAGTTALSAGILAVALAAILFALRDLKRIALLGGGGSGARAAESSTPAAAAPTGLVAPVPIVAPIRADVAPHRAGSPAAEPDPAPFRPTLADEASAEQAATVVGRYEANGSHYVLFSDGTIEVETEAGTHRYASMQELRAHIEREEQR